MMKRLIRMFLGCEKEAQIMWEDGVYWGSAATQDGANAIDLLEAAYKIKRVAADSLKAKEERLKKYRL